MARLAFLGAARTVTGSQYVLTLPAGSIMVDCGLYQGEKSLRLLNWADPDFDVAGLKWLILTHTHLDHIGRVPRLVKQGFRGRILCTPPTRQLAELLLKDSAHLQKEDAGYFNRKGLTKHSPALPLYDEADVEEALGLFDEVPLGQERELLPGARFAYRGAGHILGAASADFHLQEQQRTTRIVFSGDIGRFGAVLTKDPLLAPGSVDYVVMESTYGDRLHERADVLDELEAILQRTFDRGGVLLIPAFAVSRAQQMIYLLDQIVTSGRMRPFPIHLDSPMAVDATRIYARFPDAHRVSLRSIGGATLLHGRWVHHHKTRKESEALNDFRGPGVIISASGMLSGGRILHHCRVRLPRAENSLLIVGYQAATTLGRALVDGAKVVRIHKHEVVVRAEVGQLHGLSGHADADELMRWLSGVQDPPQCVFVTHGEEASALALAERIRRERGFRALVPSMHQRVDLAAQS